MKTFWKIVIIVGFLSATIVTADITINGETINIETDNYTVQLDRGVITYLNNKLTDETYTLSPETNRMPDFRARTGMLRRGISTHKASIVEIQKVNPRQVEMLFRKGDNKIRLLVSIEPFTNDLLISGDCVSDSPGASGMQWGIENLNLQNLRLIIPSEKKQIIDASFGLKSAKFRYPSYYWEAQLVIIEAERGGFYVRGTDPTFQFKELHYQSDADSFGLEFRTHNHAPWDTLTSAQSITWRLNTYAGDWCVPAQIHRDWMESAFDPRRLSDVPAWVSDIGLLVGINMLHTRIEMFKEIAKVVDPTKTLLYFVEWRKEGKDTNYPDYSNPHEKFELYLETARTHGYRVMLHVNVHNCSPNHPLYPQFNRFQIRHLNGELSGYLWNEIDNPHRNAHISLASSQWRNLLVQRFKAVWEKYKPDAFYLDTAHLVINDANGLIEGLSSAQGNVLLHQALAEATPGVMFSGEGLHEVTFFRESLATRGFTEPPYHPLSAFLFSPYTRFHGASNTPATREPRYYLWLETAETQGYLPTLWIWRQGILDLPLTQEILAVARRWQELGLSPDIGCDWGPDTLFQYTSRTGETITHQDTAEGSILIQTNPDLNRDGKVNILDLIIISNQLGQQVPEAFPGDLNGDGAINILDLILIAQGMNNTP